MGLLVAAGAALSPSKSIRPVLSPIQPIATRRIQNAVKPAIVVKFASALLILFSLLVKKPCVDLAAECVQNTRQLPMSSGFGWLMGRLAVVAGRFLFLKQRLTFYSAPCYLSTMNTAAVIKELKIWVKAAGSQAAFCVTHGVDHAALSKVLAGKIDPPPAILRVLKLEKVVTVSYRRK